ncbi:hypothetical protein N473_02950 [Pseudoalteromonas luteoviolacea CPMOR-1]|uniref:Uncharacterized protein n=1 Tax=Pseudoalteromonas luteoviolacea CPMOR-1 TaxID=1365248 RepID=A0A167ITA6_9GAMM|nr:hypothetical protein [Pseudoalteromonas luteoviolacea]KZN59892.1 hypothetical protein N473_02950 [Pseudoalteromonas luteoviolacea CPMOR-1]
MDIISFIGTFVGLLGFGFALWQHHQVKKLSEHIRANNWFMYQRINNANVTIQLALELYKKKQDLDNDVLEQLARADACGQEVFKEIIK